VGAERRSSIREGGGRGERRQIYAQRQEGERKRNAAPVIHRLEFRKEKKKKENELSYPLSSRRKGKGKRGDSA